jgi:hypothetical protein
MVASADRRCGRQQSYRTADARLMPGGEVSTLLAESVKKTLLKTVTRQPFDRSKLLFLT